MENNYIMYIIGIVAFIILLPVVLNVVSPIYTLNYAANDSVAFTDEGAVSHGQATNFPINGQLTQCANATAVLTIPEQCNVSTASNGTVQIMDTLSKAATYNLRYYWEDARYGQSTTERSVASTIFVMVLLGLFMAAASIVGGFGGG